MSHTPPLSFHASAIEGTGRGRTYGIPTVNIDLSAVPEELQEGIFACYVTLENDPVRYRGAMHYGPRPVFRDTRACEIHLLDTQLSSLPSAVTITVVRYLRAIRDFSSVEALKAQILDDIEQCRGILEHA